jgi:hypothetical protein
MTADKRKQIVMSERTLRCKLTGMRITNRIELSEESVPPLVEHVTLECPDVACPTVTFTSPHAARHPVVYYWSDIESRVLAWLASDAEVKS